MQPAILYEILHIIIAHQILLHHCVQNTGHQAKHYNLKPALYQIFQALIAGKVGPAKKKQEKDFCFGLLFFRHLLSCIGIG